MLIAEFLSTVVTAPEGNFCLATKAVAGGWAENWYTWPLDLDKIVEQAQLAAEHSNVYFSSHLFSERRSLKEYALPSRTIQADLDHAEIATIPVVPTVLVQTSPGRHQGYWIVDDLQSTANLETLARRIAYGVPACDKTGWSIGHKVRLPGTHNLKYPGKAHFIEVAGLALRSLEAETFNIFPELDISVERAVEDLEWVREVPEPILVPAIELLAALKGKINAKAYSQFTKPARDRSAALWGLSTEAFRAGCTREQVYHLCFNSANNKFDDRRYNGLLDLRKDILRAERYIITRAVDLKALMMDLRQSQGELVVQRRKKMAELVINTMREKGEFLHTKGGSLYYLLRATGRPVLIATHSEWLNSFLSTTFGLNATEAEHKYIVQELISYTRAMPVGNNLQTLSYYDSYRDVLLLHTGGRDVIHVSARDTQVHPNGYGNIVFDWGIVGETFSLNNSSLAEPWWEVLFEGCLDNIVGLERDETLLLLRSWFLFLLFRNLATTRPLLALFGQPGSGKTTTAKMFYRLIYGHYKSVSGISNPEDFDMDCSTMPFVCFDNADSWSAWLPDRLAQAAGNTTIGVRKLYTDMDMIYRERQALVCITAHNPRFAREDITDRLILLMFQRLTYFKSETEILERVSSLRANLWNAIIRDVQVILRTLKPTPQEIPQFRIEDYARLGAWFCKSTGPECLATFGSAVGKIQSRQKSFNIEEDYTLVAAIRRWLTKQAESAAAALASGSSLPVSAGQEFQSANAIWQQLAMYAPDPEAFKRQYKNAQILGRKLFVMQDSLKTVINIECMDSKALGTRVWKIGEREKDA